MQAQQKAASICAQLHTQDIWTFFHWSTHPQEELTTNEKNLLQPP